MAGSELEGWSERWLWMGEQCGERKESRKREISTEEEEGRGGGGGGVLWAHCTPCFY